MDFFVADRLVVETDGVGPPAVKRITWIEAGLEVQVGQISTSLYTRAQVVPSDVVQGADVIHHAMKQPGVRFGLLRVASPALMPVAPVEFEYYVGVGIVPVDGVLRAGNTMVAAVPGVLNARSVQQMAMVGFGLVVVRAGHQVVLLDFVFGQVQPGFGLQLVLRPRQPFHEARGMMDSAPPPQEGFGREGVRDEAVQLFERRLS